MKNICRILFYTRMKKHSNTQLTNSTEWSIYKGNKRNFVKLWYLTLGTFHNSGSGLSIRLFIKRIKHIALEVFYARSLKVFWNNPTFISNECAILLREIGKILKSLLCFIIYIYIGCPKKGHASSDCLWLLIGRDYQFQNCRKWNLTWFIPRQIVSSKSIHYE